MIRQILTNVQNHEEVYTKNTYVGHS